MIRFRSYKSKLQAAFLVLGLAGIAATGWQVSAGASAALRQATFDRLSAIRETRSRQIERYFEDLTNHVLALASDESAITALEQFRDAWDTLPPATDAQTALLRDHYTRDFLPLLANGPASGLETWLPSDPRTRFLQSLYIAANPHERGSKGLLLDAPGAGAYGKAHVRFHPTLQRYLTAFGFYDIFLIGADDARIVYSVSKETDLGMSLDAPPYADSPLARAYRRAMALTDMEEAVVEDYAPYAASYFSPAAFIATPVWRAGAKTGVLAIQVSVAEVNRVMTGDRHWQDEGLGQTGQSYIVGADRTLRSDFRFEIENPGEFYRRLRSAGIADDVVRKIQRNGTAILSLAVGDDVMNRMDVESGEAWMGHNVHGAPVLCSHTPLNLPGLKWILVAEIEAAEAFAPLRALQFRIFLIGLLIAAAFLIAAHFLAGSVTRPVLALASTARRFGSREFGVRIPVSSDDEIGQLAESFNRMAEDLEKTTVSKADLEVLARRLITAQEEERSRLARELHDEVTQQIAVLAIEAGRIERLAADGDTAARRDALVRLKQRLGHLSDEIHGLSRRLHPAKLDDLGVVAAVASECRASFERGGAPVHLQVDGDFAAVPRDQQLAIYRIVQEALHNAAKHAEAEQIRIDLVREAARIRLSISDDGKGFNRKSPDWRSGLGLASMEERARLLGGDFAVASSPGQGTRIEVTLPCVGEDDAKT